jgi:hypothetical protein
MQQVLHLLIVDRNRGAALAARYGSRWLLPVITSREMVRAAPLVARWCAERGVASDVAGQWLGRVGHGVTDWLLAIPARAGCPGLGESLEWTPVDALPSSASVLDYQTWALARSLNGSTLPSVAGPFGNLEWPAAVRAWIVNSGGSALSAWTPYRVGAHEVVLGAETPAGRLYFKGLAADRGGEAMLTQALAAMAPDSFARTIALESRADGSVWWLAAECPGLPRRDAHLVGMALAAIQRMTATAQGSLALPVLDLDTAGKWASDLMADSAIGETIRRTCAEAIRADVPQTWIPMDLDPTNVLVDDDGVVRFIDVDDSFFGPAPLAMATFAQRFGDAAVYSAYEQSWCQPLTGLEWRGFETVARVVQAWLGWSRLTRNIERGEVYASLDLVSALIRDRLARTIYRR